MGIGDEFGKETLEELNRDIPQWLMQLRMVGMDLIDHFFDNLRTHEFVAGFRKKEDS